MGEQNLNLKQKRRLEMLKRSIENDRESALEQFQQKNKQRMIDICVEEFKKNKNEKRMYIENIKQQIDEEGLNINLDVIENSAKYGYAAVSRNRIIDLCKTKYLAFLDGDDEIKLDAIRKYINECRNNESGNCEGRCSYISYDEDNENN